MDDFLPWSVIKLNDPCPNPNFTTPTLAPLVNASVISPYVESLSHGCVNGASPILMQCMYGLINFATGPIQYKWAFVAFFFSVGLQACIDIADSSLDGGWIGDSVFYE